MNCYAERIATRFGGEGMPYEGLVTIRSKHPQTGRPTTGVRGKWTGVVRFLPEILGKPLHWQLPQKVFVNSMSDLFHENVTNEQIAAAFGVMAACPHHTFQILTKRIKRALDWFTWILREAAAANDNRGMTPAARCFVEAQRMSGDPKLARREFLRPALAATWPLPNVWLGVSVENQEAAEERVPFLLRAPAAVRFLSCEPLLQKVELQSMRGWLAPFHSPHAMLRGVGYTRVDWVIAGCESGPGARSCDIEWLRSLRNQCATSDVAFFLKQAKEDVGPRGTISSIRDRPPFADLESQTTARRKGAGKIIELPYLDGVQHAAFPEAV
jgi:protein gp37